MVHRSGQKVLQKRKQEYYATIIWRVTIRRGSPAFFPLGSNYENIISFNRALSLTNTSVQHLHPLKKQQL